MKAVTSSEWLLLMGVVFSSILEVAYSLNQFSILLDSPRG